MIEKGEVDGQYCISTLIHFPLDMNPKQPTLCPEPNEGKNNDIQLGLTKPSKTLTFVCKYPSKQEV